MLHRKREANSFIYNNLAATQENIISGDNYLNLISLYRSSAPARICLYGEHQDYLQQKVIPAAINLRLNIYSEESNKNYITVMSRDLGETIHVNPHIRDISNISNIFQSFMEAGIIALKQKIKDIEIPNINTKIESFIPVASGLSSSAALLVGWISHIIGILQLDLDKRDIAELAYSAEHDIMQIPCGKMDQYSSSFGSIISLSCVEPPELTYLKQIESELIIVSSNSPKLTSSVHGSKVEKIQSAVMKLEKLVDSKLNEINKSDLNENDKYLTSEEYTILQAVLSIKEDTLLAEHELKSSNPNLEKLGKLLTSQQKSLRDGIKVSLPILDKIVNIGISEGALGGKLTGAGLGGCVVLLVEKNGTEIVEKLKKKLQLPVWLVEIDEGVFFQELENR